MSTPRHFKISLLTAALLLGAPLAQAAPTLSDADFSSGKTRISTAYQADKAACGAMTGNAKDVCQEEAKAKEKNARAELTFQHSGLAADGTKLRTARAESAYAVAKEKCDDRNGNAKDVCVKEAKAVQVKALAEAQVIQEVGNATSEASAEIRDADYKVAVEKCDAMTGDAKTACVNTAKKRFGKS